MALSHDDVREILAIIDAAGPSELRIETEGFTLHVRMGDGVAPSSLEPVPAASDPAPAEGAAPAEQAEPAAPAAPAERGAPTDPGTQTIESPMLGTFYRAESPGAAPFVEVGSEVEPDTVVCIIEVMKMMNSITAGMAGRIVEVCPANAQLVEFGEPLFRVAPAGTE